MQVVVIAGGKGTRLKSRLAGLPKPMMDVGGKPLLEHQLVLARKHGMKDVLLLTGFGAEHIENYFGDGSKWDLRIAYRREVRPMGTAGAVLDVFSELDDTFVVMYGDTMLNVDLGRMLAAHPEDAAATLFLHPNDHPKDSDLVEVDAANRIAALHPYPHLPDKFFGNLVNAALYVVRKSALVEFARSAKGADAGRRTREELVSFLGGALDTATVLRELSKSGPLDFARQLFPALLANGANLHGYISREYIKDAGTPKRLDRVRLDYESGRIRMGSLETPAPAVFLDRDGTLNVERGWLTSPEQVELLPGAAAAVRAINQSGRLAVLVTNQPVIARGDCTEVELKAIHDKLEWLLGEEHAFVDAIYYCPHHPNSGFAGERPELKFACTCRKPEIGLFEQAAREMNIDLGRSWMIGDRATDVQAAKTLGISAAQVRTGPFAHDRSHACQPDGIFDHILDAVSFILSKELAQV